MFKMSQCDREVFCYCFLPVMFLAKLVAGGVAVRMAKTVMVCGLDHLDLD